MEKNIDKTMLSRRASLVGLSAVILQGLGVGVASSDGGGEAGGQFNSANSKKKKKKKGSNKVRVIYTQKNVGKISGKDLKTAIRGIKTGHDITIEGFSKNMSRKLFEALLVAPWRTKNLIKFMSRLPVGSFERDDAFRAAIKLLEEQLVELRKELTNIFGTDPEIKSLKTLLKTIKHWRKNPKEGTLKNTK